MPARRKSRAEIEANGNAGGHTKADLATRAAEPVAVKQLVDSVPPVGDAPDYLSEDARRVWDLASPALKAVQLLGEPDRIAFARYCGWLAEFWTLDRGRKGKAVTTTKSRAVKMQRLDRGFQARLMLDKRLMEYEDRFGMNPEARQAIFAKLAAGYQPANKATQPGPGPLAGGTAEPKKPAGPIGFLKTSAEPPRRLQ
jgi:phage terminase small subunit